MKGKKNTVHDKNEIKHINMKFNFRKIVWGLIVAAMPFVSKAQEATQVPLQLTLDQAIEIALSESPSIKLANLEIQKKKYAKRSAQSSLYPQIDAVGQYQRTLKKQVMYMDGAFDMASMMSPIINGIDDTFASNISGYVPNSINSNNEPVPGELLQNIGKNTPPPTDSSEGISVGRDNNWTAGFNLSWPIVVPTLWKSLQISSLDVELAVEQSRASKIDMINAVRKSFYIVMLAQDSYNVFKESYDNAAFNYNVIKNRFEQGISSEFDLIRTDVHMKTVHPNVVQAKNALNLATLSLKALMGIDMDQEISISGSLKDYEEGLFAEIISLDTSLRNNSNLKQFDLQNEQLKKTLGLFRAQYMPTIAVSGSYLYMSMNNDFKFGDYKWNPYSFASVSISIPIFDGFKKHSNIQQTKASLAQMKWQREDVIRSLRLAINNNVNNMTNSVEQIISTKDAVALAQKGYEIAQKLYNTGMGTLLDLNDAQLALTQTSLAFNQAIYSYLASKADLDKTLGIEPDLK